MARIDSRRFGGWTEWLRYFFFIIILSLLLFYITGSDLLLADEWVLVSSGNGVCLI